MALLWSAPSVTLRCYDAPPGAAAVLTGVQLGAVRYEWRFFDRHPGEPPQGWDWIQEVAVEANGPIDVEGWGAQTRELVDLAVRGPEIYGIRCSVRGRGGDSVTATEHPDERYLLEVWHVGDSDAPEHEGVRNDADDPWAGRKAELRNLGLTPRQIAAYDFESEAEKEPRPDEYLPE